MTHKNFRSLIYVYSLISLLFVSSAYGQSSASTDGQTENQNVLESALTPAPIQETDSQARQITALRNLLGVNKNRIDRLKSELGKHKREFTLRSQNFSKLDAEAAKLNDQENREEDDASKAASRNLRSKWQRARDEFDFVINITQTKESLVAILEQKRAGFETGMEQLLNPDGFRDKIKKSLLGQSGSNEEGQKASSDAGPASLHPMFSILTALENRADSTEQASPAQQDLRFDYRSADAAKRVFEKQVALAVEDRKAKLIDNLLTLSTNDLAKIDELAALINNHQEKLRDWLAAADSDQAQTASETPLPPQEINRIKREQQSLARSLETLMRDKDLVASTIAGLERRRAESGKALDQAESKLDDAIRTLEFVQSPFAPHRMKRWLVQKLPGMLLTILVIVAAWFVLRSVTNRLIQVLEAGTRRGSTEERKERAETIHRVFRNIVSVVLLVVGIILLLDQAGIDVTVLLGSAALIGVAVTFGAQSLIRDYFHGALVLIEDQFRVGNVVKVGDITGTVEDITLRMMILRDLAGTVHFIPHGEVTKVSNLTYGWARVVFDIGVAYKEEVDQVMELLMKLASDLKKDKEFGKFILGEPEMLGVDAFADSAVNIKFLVKTRPLKQWIIKRELLRRIKNTFDQQGIEIPFPHRTLYMGESAESFEKNIGVNE